MSFSCLVQEGWNLGCNVVGGVKRAWVGTWSAESTYQYDIDNIITGVTSGITVYEIEMDIEFGSFVSNGAFSRENGSVFYETLVGFKFVHLTAELRNLINAIGRAPLVCIVESNSGEFYYCGVSSAGRASEGIAQTGQALGDHNGATLTISFKDAYPPYLLDPTVLGTDIPIG
jgi:hypothetical protein